MAENWAQIFDEGFASPASAVTQRVWREVYGPEYPDGVEPYSYVTRSELARFCVDLAIDDKAHLVDIGCGRGGPGLWVAAHTGARLTGVDIAARALKASEERARSLGLENRTRYLLGSFDALPLESNSADAIMSVDALLFAPDKRVAVAEMARVLRQHGRLVFTSWDYHSQPVGRPPQVEDHRPLLRAGGFDVKAYDETDDWLARQSRTATGLLAGAEELAAESGSDAATVRKDLHEMVATFATMLRRVFVVAQKQ
ncbi:MAG: class I SAM-dependent methyltransferase [Proteobacteria bacterium]|nr:MAG: class I SAM-dependent methyltransferase [Pseudomonadota bacterium]